MAIAETYEHLYPHNGDRVDGRVALVTGGTRGIGAAISRRLAAHGASVAAGYGRDPERARQLQAELAQGGAPISIHVGDVGSADDCRRMVQDVIDHHEFRLDVRAIGDHAAQHVVADPIGGVSDDVVHEVLAVGVVHDVAMPTPAPTRITSRR